MVKSWGNTPIPKTKNLTPIKVGGGGFEPPKA